MRIDDLTIDDLRQHPVWRYVSDPAGDETSVQPLTRLPTAKLSGKFVGTEIVLANGTRVWALIGNVDASNPLLTKHFLTLSVARDGRWFHAARYHDFDYEQRGPTTLARFLGLPLDEVFPISYDLRPYAKGDPLALAGTILNEPTNRLTRAEIIALAVP